MDRTKHLRCSNYLMITTVKPYKAASPATISRWVKSVLKAAGLGNTFKPHSTRAASTSKANHLGVSWQTILDAGGWSNAKTFAKYYSKEVNDENKHSLVFQSAILCGK